MSRVDYTLGGDQNNAKYELSMYFGNIHDDYLNGTEHQRRLSDPCGLHIRFATPGVPISSAALVLIAYAGEGWVGGWGVGGGGGGGGWGWGWGWGGGGGGWGSGSGLP